MVFKLRRDVHNDSPCHNGVYSGTIRYSLSEYIQAIISRNHNAILWAKHKANLCCHVAQNMIRKSIVRGACVCVAVVFFAPQKLRGVRSFKLEFTSGECDGTILSNHIALPNLRPAISARRAPQSTPAPARLQASIVHGTHFTLIWSLKLSADLDRAYDDRLILGAPLIINERG